ncbi:MAG: ScpA family protein [bacterium]
MKLDYQVFHTEFKGPLQALLESSRSQDVPLSKIDLSVLIDDFSRYLSLNEGSSVNRVSRYLLVFSELVRIKTRLLLPGDDDPDETEEVQDADRESQQFYQVVSDQLKSKAKHRAQLYESTPDSLPDSVTAGETKYREVTLYELMQAFQKIVETTRESQAPDIELTNEFETADQMEYILEVIEERKRVPFLDLLSSSPSREEVIVTFLAILQLVKQDDLRLLQPVSGGHIEVLHPEYLDEAS